MENSKTTVQISVNTKKLLDELKAYPGESMDTLIKRLAESNFDEEPISKSELDGIKRSIKDIEAGRTRSLDDITKELGI